MRTLREESLYAAAEIVRMAAWLDSLSHEPAAEVRREVRVYANQLRTIGNRLKVVADSGVTTMPKDKKTVELDADLAHSALLALGWWVCDNVRGSFSDCDLDGLERAVAPFEAAKVGGVDCE